MKTTLRHTLTALACAVFIAQADDRSPKRTIEIYVSPYYSMEAGKTPQINTGIPEYDRLLASDKREDILAVRDKISADNRMITPMTMMVLANRLYDVNERDEGLFWHYAAKNRFWTLANSVDIEASGLAEAKHAMSAFVKLAGPYHNSYAFCDPAKQQAIAKRAIDWVEKNPFGAIFIEQFKRLPGDPETNIADTIRKLRDNQAQEQAFMNDPAKWAEYQQQRRENHVDEQFCYP